MAVDFEDPTYLEQVFAALFALLQKVTFPAGVPPLARTSRVVVVGDQVPPAEQPALILIQGPMHVAQKEVFGPAKWELTVVVVILFRGDATAPASQDQVSAQTVNYMVWGLMLAVSGRQGPSPQQQYARQTLGGLVYHCWIEGVVDTEVQDQQVILTVPIHILL
jgi:hypothetical protein